MRVRSFFWFLITFICLGVLIFAAAIQRDVPAVLQIQLDRQQPSALSFTSVRIQLSDPDGQPIEQARISSQVQMTNMPMSVNPSTISYLGNGIYNVRVQFSMAGPWAIKVTANAHGFHPQQRTLMVDVV